ncbi:hypothetical protein HK100_011071, partial [Physocladia obscura]
MPNRRLEKIKPSVSSPSSPLKKDDEQYESSSSFAQVRHNSRNQTRKLSRATIANTNSNNDFDADDFEFDQTSAPPIPIASSRKVIPSWTASKSAAEKRASTQSETISNTIETSATATNDSAIKTRSGSSDSKSGAGTAAAVKHDGHSSLVTRSDFSSGFASRRSSDKQGNLRHDCRSYSSSSSASTPTSSAASSISEDEEEATRKPTGSLAKLTSAFKSFTRKKTVIEKVSSVDGGGGGGGWNTVAGFLENVKSSSVKKLPNLPHISVAPDNDNDNDNNNADENTYTKTNHEFPADKERLLLSPNSPQQYRQQEFSICDIDNPDSNNINLDFINARLAKRATILRKKSSITSSEKQVLLHRFDSTTTGRKTHDIESYPSMRRSDYGVKKSSASHSQFGINTQMGNNENDEIVMDSLKYHPIVQWMIEVQASLMDSMAFKQFVDFLASDRTKIVLNLALMLMMHTTLIVLLQIYFRISLILFICPPPLEKKVMPGIYIYNFIQIFVIGCTLIAHNASHRISAIVGTSIAAGNLVRGRIKLHELADYWVHGTHRPAHQVTFSSEAIEFIADVIVVWSSISFSWTNVVTMVLDGQCMPPTYIGSVLP